MPAMIDNQPLITAPDLAKSAVGAGILYRGNPPALFTGHDVGWKCRKCGSTDLKKVSLVYQDGLSRVKTRSRLVGFIFGGPGPAILTGTSVKQGILQSELSTSLNPPSKWSYAKLIVGAFFITCLALFAYIVFASASAPPVSTLPVKLYVFLAPLAFLFLVAIFWRHNYLVYPRQYAEWDRSFLCQRWLPSRPWYLNHSTGLFAPTPRDEFCHRPREPSPGGGWTGRRQWRVAGGGVILRRAMSWGSLLLRRFAFSPKEHPRPSRDIPRFCGRPRGPFPP